jgi:hypothetical protein
MFDNLSAEQLRDEYATYARAEQATTDAPPLPENAPGNLTPAQQQILSDNYIGFVLNRPPQTWTAREREDVRLAARAAMRTL